MAHAGHLSERLNHTTQLRIDWTNGIPLHHNATITQDWQGTERAQGGSVAAPAEGTQQQVGSCHTAMNQDGREILPDADYAQEMRVTAHAGCPMERRSVKRPTTTSTSHALWDRWNTLGMESIPRPRMTHTSGGVVHREQRPRDAD